MRLRHVRCFTLLLAALWLLSWSPLTLCAGKPLVLCTTTVLASIVRDLAGGEVVIATITPPTICPAHYDVKPSDLLKVANADLIFYHGFEPWVRIISEAVGAKAPMVKVPGPWNTPSLLSRKYVLVAQALAQYLHLDLNSSLAACLRGIENADKMLKAISRANGFEGTPVVCALFQRGYLAYLGFECVATYGPPEMVSAKLYSEVIRNATESRAFLVVDNLQSGTELGKRIAEEIGGVEVALTNFPDIRPGLSNMTDVMVWNANLLTKALRGAEGGS